MNTLQEQIEEDFKNAFRAGKKDEVSLLRALKSAFGNASLKKGSMTTPLTLDEAITVVRKQLEQRNDSMAQFVKGNRPDLALKEKAEAELLEKYLPVEITDEALDDLISVILASYDNPTKKQMGEIINSVFEVSNGQANRKRIAAAVSIYLK